MNWGIFDIQYAMQARTQGGFGIHPPPLCTDGVLKPPPFVRTPPPPWFFFFLLVTPEVDQVDGRYPYPKALHDFRRWWRRGAYRFEPEIVKKAEMQGAVPGCSCCRAFPMITTMSIKDSATMTGRLHLSLFVFSLQFIFGCVIREKRVPQHSQTRTSWTRSHGLAPRHPPFPALNSRGWRGWLMLALRRRTISVG